MKKLSRQQRRQQERKGIPKVRRSRFKALVLFGTAILLLFGSVGAFAIYQSMHNPRVTSAEAEAAVNATLNAANPELPENSYMTPFMREKISFMLIGLSAGAIEKKYVEGTYQPTLHRPDPIMLINVTAGHPTLWIYVSRWLYLVNRTTGNWHEPNQHLKDLFALSLAHEATHLEKIKADDQGIRAEHVAEELRVWTKLDTLAVHPMRLMGRSLDPSMLQFDDSLQKCTDKGNCLPAQRLIDWATPP